MSDKTFPADYEGGTIETWVPIDGYEGLYEVSNFGGVRSFSRKSYRGKLLVQQAEPPKAEGGMSMSCEYCHEDRDGYIVPLDKNSHAFLKYPNLLVIKFGKERRECVIRFCPMCGRELKK